MRLKLGIPDMLGSVPLARRLAGLTAARLLLLSLSLALVGAFYLRGKFGLGSFTLRVAVQTFGLSFALTGVYAALLRQGRHLERLAETQLVLDQLTWTVVAYLTGGASSGATSFYGLSCLVGASLARSPRRSFGGVVRGHFFTAAWCSRCNAGCCLRRPISPRASITCLRTS